MDDDDFAASSAPVDDHVAAPMAGPSYPPIGSGAPAVNTAVAASNTGTLVVTPQQPQPITVLNVGGIDSEYIHRPSFAG